MFLSLIKEEDLAEVKWYILYISRLSQDNLILHSGAIIFDAFVPKRVKNRIHIFKRKVKYEYQAPYLTEIPKYIMVCYFEYFIFQIPIFDIKNLNLYKREININMMPIFIDYDLFSDEDIEWRLLDWHSDESTTCKQQLKFKFEESDSSEAIKTRAEEIFMNNKFN